MKTPVEKYQNDPHYRQLVNIIEAQIHNAVFTPSEIREACIFACIRYEMSRPRSIVVPTHIQDALENLNQYAHEKQDGE